MGTERRKRGDEGKKKEVRRKGMNTKEKTGGRKRRASREGARSWGGRPPLSSPLSFPLSPLAKRERRKRIV